MIDSGLWPLPAPFLAVDQLRWGRRAVALSVRLGRGRDWAGEPARELLAACGELAGITREVTALLAALGAALGGDSS